MSKMTYFCMTAIVVRHLHMISLSKVRCTLWKGWMKQMTPTIMVETKTPAPNKAPNARPESPSLELPTAAMALNTSGAPLPNARNVTPAMFCESFMLSAIVRSDGQKLKKEISESNRGQAKKQKKSAENFWTWPSDSVVFFLECRGNSLKDFNSA